MKTMKKVFALALAVMLVVAMTVPAAAADGEEVTYTITVQGNASGHIYEAYQIFSGILDSSGVLTGVEWGSGIDVASGFDVLCR